MNETTRRDVLKKMLAGSVAMVAAGGLPACAGASAEQTQPPVLKKNINHSVCRWTYDFLSLEALCRMVKEIGFSAIDLVGPAEWHILKAQGIDSSMCNGAEISLEDGWNEPANHARLLQNYRDMIPKVAQAGYKNLICFSGNRRGMSEEEGLQNSVAGLQQLMPLAEQHRVVMQLELFNSKVNHPDYMADSSAWGIELCRRLGSQNFKLLYDIYHMQIMEGDIIRTIQDHHAWFGHYHTAGVPGRHEIDQSQELYYPAIMRAIVASGYTGYVAQEFIPQKEDKVASLREAILLCDV
ncbi:hydroxypyruvate isomerase family protein [Cesiribacter andamanensis]|uniref:Hydroxypyruvate isomerase n=1 Tax=Cesiribacter andamanensis AMV16 TaxID=1279009 RepID=M7NV91_9BACT|nr:TIM barrel protein [Cesiribacter andamanensis]EMR02374.1 Hydroxypyruvate isomerase [Cesiribacter andamanensis AMV16]